ITLVFKNDPLVSIEVHSTFDSVPSVRRNLQRDIEETLRSMFQEELPSIVHEMSVRQIRREQERQEQLRRAKISAQQAYLRNRAVSRASADAYSDVTRAAHAATRSIGSLQSAPANSYFFPYEGSEERDPSLQQAIPATAGAPEPWSLSPVAADDVWEAFGPHSRSDISSQLYTRLSLLHKQGGVNQTTTTEPNQGEARSEPGGRESVRASIAATGHAAEARRAHYTTDAAINPDDNATANRGTQSRLEHRDRLVLRPTDTQVAAELASLMAM
ncbi:ERMES complex subunit, partial [Spiromyces aspiralis]